MLLQLADWIEKPRFPCSKNRSDIRKLILCKASSKGAVIA